MLNWKNTLLAAATVLVGLSSTALANEAPTGWHMAGSQPDAYKVTQDSIIKHGKTRSARLQSLKSIDGFGTLMQSVDAELYRGKTVRLSGFVKADNVTNMAGLWMRIDGKNDEMLGFDNMQDRPIKGTSEWKKYEVVLDVPQQSEAIAFGILLSGPGSVWLDDVNLEVVKKAIPTTDILKKKTFRKKSPDNLGFEK